MPDLGRRAYAFAKASGIIGKSCIGRRVSRLRSLTQLAELDRLLFPGETRDLPGEELLRDLEKRITGRAVRQMLSIAGAYPKPPETLARLLRAYEYADVKSLLNFLGSGEKGTPFFTDIRPFGTVRWAAYPNLGAMFQNTEFEWVSGEKPESLTGEELMLLQARLDRQYYDRLWKSVLRLPGSDRRAAELILGEEISLLNCMWVLRLRCYYRLSPEKIRDYLLDIRLKSGRSASADAVAALGFALDNFAAWQSWRKRSFLNPGTPGEVWRPEPRFFQSAASRHLYHLARRYFRGRPFSLDTMVCFIKLKQFEEDLLTSVAEGLGMGMSGGDILTLLGAEA
jgi:vacuolar-type H+-ATPase subunit C/Vma6